MKSVACQTPPPLPALHIKWNSVCTATPTAIHIRMSEINIYIKLYILITLWSVRLYSSRVLRDKTICCIYILYRPICNKNKNTVDYRNSFYMINRFHITNQNMKMSKTECLDSVPAQTIRRYMCFCSGTCAFVCSWHNPLSPPKVKNVLFNTYFTLGGDSGLCQSFL